MTTVVISDLHLGERAGRDVLREPRALERLLERLEEADRLVIVGDALELRQAPASHVLQAVRPVLAALGEAMKGRPVVLVPGNHDHQLVAPWLERRRLSSSSPMGPEQVTDASRAGPLAAAVKKALGTELQVAYPGLWIRPGVWATHGHYLDCHMTVPRLECIVAAGMERVTGRLPAEDVTPDDYERVLGPIYAFSHNLAQGARPLSGNVSPDVSLRAWRLLDGGGVLGAARSLLLGGVVAPALLSTLNSVVPRKFGFDLSARELMRSGLRGIAEVVGRLGVEADHVIFGHTHRSGPHPGEDQPEWTAPGGTGLMNTGTWLNEPSFYGSGAMGPYFPGMAVIVPDSGPPELVRLLEPEDLALS